MKEQLTISQNTRLNSISLNLQLNQWKFIQNQNVPYATIQLKLGSLQFKQIQSIIDFLSKNLFGDFTFSIVDHENVKDFKVVKQPGFIPDPPIIISSMVRGIVANRINEYTMILDIRMLLPEAIKLFEHLQSIAHKDLKYRFTREVTIKEAMKNEKH